MSSPVEYLFAADLIVADRTARSIGWRSHGRTGWIKPDGIEVHFICFPEQLEAVGKHATVYAVGELSPALKRIGRKWTKLRT